MQLLLGGQATDANTLNWFEKVRIHETTHKTKVTFFASEISLGEIFQAAENAKTPVERQAWKDTIGNFEKHWSARLLPFSGEAVRQWSLIRCSQRIQGLFLPRSRQVVATALADNLTYAGSRTDVPDELTCKIFDPSRGEVWP